MCIRDSGDGGTGHVDEVLVAIPFDVELAAAQEQLAAIRAVEQEYGLDGLPEGLQQAALLRIANPEASLADLAMLSSPAVTKSCLSHRLKRLVELGRGIGKGD